MNREELDLETQHVGLLEALDAAKAAYNGEEIGPTQKALKDAEWALTEFRMRWRGIRDYFAATPTTEPSAAPDDGVAAPAPVNSAINQPPKAVD